METSLPHHDLTQGPIFGRLLRVATPIMGMQLMQMLYNLADVFWMGRLSSEAVAASGTAGMFMWMAFGMMLLGRVSAEIFVSQSKGSGDMERAASASQNAVLINLFFGTLYALVMVLFRHQLVGFFNFKEASVAADARLYLVVCSLGLPFDFVYIALAGVYNASGNSKTPFVMGTIGLVINLILDPVMIFLMDMGIMGAALSTSLAQILSSVLILIAIKRGKNRPFEHFKVFKKPDFALIRQMLEKSVPAACESMLFTAMAMISQRFVASFSASAIAVGRVGSQFESFTWLLGGGFASAFTAFVGQNYGAKKWARIRSGLRISTLIMLVWGIMAMALLFFASGFFFSIFLPGRPDEIALGIQFGRLIALCQIPQCFEGISASTFKGTGKTIPSLIVSLTCNASRVLLAYFLAKTSLGVLGVWLAISLGAIARGVWLTLWNRIYLKRQPVVDAA